MSSDHEDAYYEAFRSLNRDAASDVERHIGSWVLNGAPTGMTVGQVQSLKETLTTKLHHHMRQVFELSRVKR